LRNPLRHGIADHGLIPAGVGGVLREPGGDDQAVAADGVLGVAALDEPAAGTGISRESGPVTLRRAGSRGACPTCARAASTACARSSRVRAARTPV
jgi:hypothetical protein